MSAYDQESFYSFHDYEKLQKSQPIPLSSWNDITFDFYEMRFANGVVVYLLNSLKEAIQFKKYCNFPNDSVPFIGEIKDIQNRIVVESIKRSATDLIELCGQLAETREYGFIYIPFKLSYQE